MAKKTPTDIANIPLPDLTYAVNCLIANGQTTAAEVTQLAAERTKRIADLETELAVLKHGGAAGSVPAKTKKRATRKTATKAKKAGKTITRKDGKTFTMTKKALAARKMQGQYMGYLRQFPEKAKAQFKALAKKEGVPVAVEEMKQQLGKSEAAPKKAAAKKTRAKKASKRATKKVAKKKAARKPRAPRATSAARQKNVAAVAKYIKSSKGVALADVVAATKLTKPQAAGAIRELKQAGKVYQGGDRRFARYASSKKAAEKASLAARKGE